MDGAYLCDVLERIVCVAHPGTNTLLCKRFLLLGCGRFGRASVWERLLGVKTKSTNPFRARKEPSLGDSRRAVSREDVSELEPEDCRAARRSKQERCACSRVPSRWPELDLR
jgi:hypothetical protein